MFYNPIPVLEQVGGVFLLSNVQNLYFCSRHHLLAKLHDQKAPHSELCDN